MNTFWWIVIVVGASLSGGSIGWSIGWNMKVRRAGGDRDFEKLVHKLGADNTKIVAELATAKESLASIEKMMKDVE